MGPDFPEQTRIELFADASRPFVDVQVLARTVASNREFPIYSFVLGSKDRSHPTFGLFGGVHGLERVGTHVVMAYLESLVAQLRWDSGLRQKLETTRIVAIPLINPGGMYLGSRSNPNGVDLMRNSPVEAMEKTQPLIGGHRISPKLPWYRGGEGKSMEIEAQELVNFVEREVFSSQTAMTLDIHSGFGFQDRLWYPYAKSRMMFPRLSEVENLKRLLDTSYPNHIYRVESQSVNYTTHGDLWDYLFDLHLERHQLGDRVFIPWTLEIGSWLWIRKNPRQLFSALGPFNPIKVHRRRRTMRRHLPLLDFLFRAVNNYSSWKRS
jgi:hypothetical protein